MPRNVQNPIVAELLTHAFQLTGHGHFDLDELVVPTIQVGALDCGFPPAKCRSAMVRGVSAAVLAEFGYFRFLAPAGVLAQIISVAAVPASAGALEVDLEDQFSATVTTAVTTALFSDGRLRAGGPGPGATPACQFFTGTSSGFAGEFAIPMPATGVLWEPKDLIVGRAPFPGPQAIGFGFETTANELNSISVQWREWYLT